MIKRHITVLLALGMLPWAGVHAQSQTAQTTFRVSATVNAVCEVTATDLSFGTYTSNTGTPLLGTTLLRATCTPGSTYNVGLNSSRTTLWGNSNGTNTVTGVGTGLAVDHTVFGAVPVAQVIPAGGYADTTTVRVYY